MTETDPNIIHTEHLDQNSKARLARRIWKVWGYCRQHAVSLSSDTHCRAIEAMTAESINIGLAKLDGLIGAANAGRIEANNKLAVVRKELSGFKKRCVDLTSSNKALRSAGDEYRDRQRKLKADLGDQKKKNRDHRHEKKLLKAQIRELGGIPNVGSEGHGDPEAPEPSGQSGVDTGVLGGHAGRVDGTPDGEGDPSGGTGGS